MAADGYWRYGEATRLPATMGPPPTVSGVKRPRNDYLDMPTGPEMHSYYPHDEGRIGYPQIRDTESINASYDRYLRNGISSYGSDPLRPGVVGLSSRPLGDLSSVGAREGRNIGFGAGRLEAPVHLPPDASNTLFVEGLPADCTRREVSHIFRPFVGFQEVRLVTKESRRTGGDPLVLCFVDFESPSQAAAALDALQGENMPLYLRFVQIFEIIPLELFISQACLVSAINCWAYLHPVRCSNLFNVLPTYMLLLDLFCPSIFLVLLMFMVGGSMVS